jgi:hypothetical protein
VVHAQPVFIAVLTLLASLSTTSSLAHGDHGNPISPAAVSTKPSIASSAQTSSCDSAALGQGNVGVAFRSGVDGSFIDGLNSRNSNVPVAADEGLWVASKGLPLGARILMSLSDIKAPADGRAFLKLGIKVFYEQGKLVLSPVKLLVETNLGRLSVGAYNQQLSTMEVSTTTGQACLNLVAPIVPGESLVRVSSGAVKVQGKVDFVPDLRPMFALGLVEGSLSLTKFKKDALTPKIEATDFSEELRNFEKTTESDNGDTRQTAAGRVAFFVKGTVKGEYLLTAALDTDKIVKDKLFRDIDPNTYYPIYGDASVKNFDAQSKSRLYVRIDKDKSYLLYGDYNTASNDEAIKLANYSRSLTGAKVHYENEGVKVNVWGSKDTLRAYVDERPGLGISGPYTLGKPNAIANSEKVELLVRDRGYSIGILKRELLTRFVDYDFEPFTGKILFRKPVPSVDELGNPVSIRITYEIDEGGEKFWVGGVDASVKLGALSVGASHVEDKNTISPHKLSGLNAQLKLGEQTFVVAELAQSKGTQFYNQSIESITQATTGYTTSLGGVVPTPIVQSGQAARIEIRHNSDDVQARAFANKADAGFQNSNAGISPGREEAGLQGTMRISKELSIRAEVGHAKDVTTASSRDNASLSANYKFGDEWMVDVGVSHVKELGVVGGLSVANTQAGLSNAQGLGWGNSGYGLSGSNLLVTPSSAAITTGNAAAIDNEYTSLRTRITGKLTDDISLYGEYERATDATGRQRSAIGGEYRINEKSRLYARHEFENTLSSNVNGISLEGAPTRSSVIGIDAEYMKDGQVFSEYRLSGAQNGLDATAAVGVRNQWQITDGFTINTSAERQSFRPFEGAKGDAVAMSLGALYSANPIYKLGGKLEYRTTRPTDQWNATFAYDRKLDNNWSGLMRNLWVYTHDKWDTGAGDQTQNRFQLGLAYRDMTTNKLNGLLRLEHRIDNSTALTDPRQSATTIFSVHGNYHPIRSTTLNGQVAFKSVNETFNQVKSNWQGSLISGRYTYDINDRFDASLMGSRMWGNGSTLTGLGAEIGARVMDDVWLGLSYNKGKFIDTELFSSNASWTGWHLRLKYKFD